MGRVSTVRILYLHPAAAFGGASKSLIEMFGALRNARIAGTVLTPAGPACTAFGRAGLQTLAVDGLSQFDNTRFGHYRGLRWLILLRELWFLPTSLMALWRLRNESFDLIHVNEVTLLPLGLLAKRWLRRPLVVHVRSLQCTPGSNRRTRWLNARLRLHADAVIAIDHTVARTLERNLQLEVVHNAIRIESPPEGDASSASGGPLRIGFLGVLVALKGVFELVEAVRILKARGVPVECTIVGENARQVSGLKSWVLGRMDMSRDVRSELQALIARHGLEHQIRMTGFVEDVRSIYPTLDVLCFPSHLNAAGRPVFEAAFFGIPSIVAVTNPEPDAMVHGVTGLAIPGPDPVLLADALERLARDSAYRQELGREARRWAQKHFALDSSAAAMLAVYRRLAGPQTAQPQKPLAADQ